jgi:uncharacterized protein (TIGR00251 family)
MSSELAIERTASGVRLGVLVAPRASREAVLGVHDGALKIALTSPPVDGAANEALVAFLARALGVTKRAVRINAGHTSRRKRVEIDGASAEAVGALVR